MRFLSYIVFLLPTILYGQERCYNFNNPKIINPSINRDVVYALSTGLCYHYNSSTLDMGYRSHRISLTFMNPNVYNRTMRMEREIYMGYTYDHKVNRNIHMGVTVATNVTDPEGVGRFYIDRRIYKEIYLHGSTVQVSNRMNHLIMGIKTNL